MSKSEYINMPRKGRGRGSRMKKYAVLMAVMLAVITSSSVLAQGEAQNFTMKLMPVTRELKASEVAPADSDNEVVIARSAQVPELEQRISALEARRAAVRRASRSRSNGITRSEIRQIEADIAQLKTDIKAIQNAGYITQTQADGLYAKIAETTPPAEAPEEKEKPMVVPTWALVALAALIAYGLFGRKSTSSAPVIERFRFDPNKEVAEAAEAVKNPGYRRIVSATAGGDYHSETARGRDVMVAEAMAQAEAMASITEYFGEMRAERAARRKHTIAMEPESEIVVVRRRTTVAVPAKTAEEKKAEEAIKVAQDEFDLAEKEVADKKSAPKAEKDAAKARFNKAKAELDKAKKDL